MVGMFLKYLSTGVGCIDVGLYMYGLYMYMRKAGG